jgi:hypothetical protein
MALHLNKAYIKASLRFSKRLLLPIPCRNTIPKEAVDFLNAAPGHFSDAEVYVGQRNKA